MIEFMSKNDQLIVKVLFGVPALFFLVFVINSFLNIGDPLENKERTDLLTNFNGTITELYRDGANHNIKTAVMSTGFKFRIPYKWESIFQIGDSLSKKKSSLKLEVFKLGQPKLILNYKETYKY